MRKVKHPYGGSIIHWQRLIKGFKRAWLEAFH